MLACESLIEPPLSSEAESEAEAEESVTELDSLADAAPELLALIPSLAEAPPPPSLPHAATTSGNDNRTTKLLSDISPPPEMNNPSDARATVRTGIISTTRNKRGNCRTTGARTRTGVRPGRTTARARLRARAAALALLERKISPEHPAIAGTLTFTGDVARSPGDLPGARAAYTHVCVIHEQAPGAERPDAVRPRPASS